VDESWVVCVCDRRALKPLRFILRSYPLYSGLTDEWGELLSSLNDSKGLCRSELTGDERETLVELVNLIEDMMYHRS
jgi:hypothetical protein